MVVADQHAFARVFAAHDIARNRVRHNARVRNREIFGDDAAPAIGSKFNRLHSNCEYTRRSKSAEDGQAGSGLCQFGRVRI